MRILLVAALLFGFPLLTGSVLAGHDARTYLMYGRETAANFREGILLPAWAAELNAGYGGPGLLFYPPLVHDLHALGGLLGAPLVLAIGVFAVIGHFLSGLAVRGWLQAEGKGEGALAAALVYMAAPYRAVDVYERSSLSEHWAFVFPPLLLFVAARPDLRPGPRIGITALVVAGLCLTNLPMAILFSAVLVVAVLRPEVALPRRLALAVGAVLGAGLSLFALVPAALSSRWTATELFYGAASRGYRPSQNTLFSSPPFLPEFNVRVSIAVLLTAGLAVLAFALSERRRTCLFWLLVALGCLAMTLPPAGLLWDALPLLSKLQFPWRAAAPMTLALAALAASISRRWRHALVIGATILSAVPFLWRQTARLADASPAPPVVESPGSRFPDPVAVSEAAGTSRNAWLHNPQLADVWYLPRTLGAPLAQEIFASGPAVFPELRDRPATATAGPPPPVQVVTWRRLTREVRVAAPSSLVLVLHTLAFPGFTVLVDGEPARAGFERRSGLVAVPLSAGEHVVTWSWSSFGPLRLARGASALFALIVAGTFLLPFRRFSVREAGPRS